MKRKSMAELYKEWKEGEINHEGYEAVKEAWENLLRR